jgi:hypothetical protein
MEGIKNGEGLSKEAIVGIVAVIVVLAAAGAYYCANQKAVRQKGESDLQISNLKKEIFALQNKNDRISAGVNMPASIQTAAQTQDESASSDVTAAVDATKDWKTYHNDRYGFEIQYPGNLKVREMQKGDIASYVVGFIADGAQENTLGVEVFSKPEEFADLISVQKSVKQGDYYLVLMGLAKDKTVQQMISTFKLDSDK